MNDLSGIAFAFLIGVLIVALIALKFRADAKRREELFAFAVRHGFEFYIEDAIGVKSLYGDFSLLSRGDSRKAYNIMSGPMGKWEIKAFDYRYSTGSGKSRQTHYLSAVVLDTDVRFSAITIRPENLFDRIAGAVGFDDIDFESHEFSRQFYVKSNDKKFAYDVIHPRMMEFLIANPEWSIEMLGRSIMICNGRTLRPEEFEKALSFADSFLGLFPDYLWQRLRS